MAQDRAPLGLFHDLQRRAVDALQDADGPLTYDALKDATPIDAHYPDGHTGQYGGRERQYDQDDIMQAVMRGLDDNGAIRSIVSDGQRRYTATEDADEIYDSGP